MKKVANTMYIAYAPCGMQTHHTLNVSSNLKKYNNNLTNISTKND